MSEYLTLKMIYDTIILHLIFNNKNMWLDMYFEKRKKWSNETEDINYFRNCNELQNIILWEINYNQWDFCINSSIVTKNNFDNIVNKSKHLLDIELFEQDIEIINKAFKNLNDNEEIIYNSNW